MLILAIIVLGTPCGLTATMRADIFVLRAEHLHALTPCRLSRVLSLTLTRRLGAVRDLAVVLNRT